MARREKLPHNRLRPLTLGVRAPLPHVNLLEQIRLAAGPVVKVPPQHLSGLLVLPLAGTFKCSAGWPRVTMASYTGAMAMAGILAVILHFIPEPAKGTKLAGAALLALFVLAAVGSGWVANILIMQRPKR